MRINLSGFPKASHIDDNVISLLELQSNNTPNFSIAYNQYTTQYTIKK